MKRKIIKIVGRYFWIMIVSTLIFFFLITYLLKGLEGIEGLYRWFKEVSFVENSNFITISTVLIGIYFSLYTYILSADPNSFFSKIKDEREYKKLIRMINFGFFSSMTTVLLSFVNIDLFNKLGYRYILILFILFIIIFGSLIEIGIYYALIFKNDFREKLNSIESVLSEDEEDRKLKKKLMDFLDRQNYD
ncbi:hypothetical protein AB6878_02450 [Carnobacterium maltaromaticum]|uniref:hypothetical protein n=1 Tax=Carnobacterium maltaromaticum TaxID=2751 RepID=UPI0039BEA1F9